MFKPFKPPLLKKVETPASVDLTASDSEPEVQHRQYKKRKLFIHTVEESLPKTLPQASQAVNAPRKPLLPVKNPIETKDASLSVPEECPEGYYMALWYAQNSDAAMLKETNSGGSYRRKFTTKKHKTWDGDGVLSVSGGYARLQDMSGREMGRSMFTDPLLPGSTLSIGGKDVEVDAIITKEDFLAGRPFLKSSMKRTISSESKSIPAKMAPAVPANLNQ
jgi:DNA repair and recombination protein RAD54B